MRVHTFANMMLKVYEILGLFQKNTVRRDLRRHSDFSTHQKFFDKAYSEIAEFIDKQHFFSQRQRHLFFYKYEQLYNEIISTTVISSLDKKEIMKTYIKITIPAIIALDIHNTLMQNKDGTIYHFYMSTLDLLSRMKAKYEPNDEFKQARYLLRQHIRSLNFSPTFDLTPIHSLINNIRPNAGQKASSIIQSIQACKKNTIQLSLQEEEKLDKLKTNYLSLNALLTFQRKTQLIKELIINHNIITCSGINSDAVINSLNKYIYSEGYDEQQLRKCASIIISRAVQSDHVEISPQYIDAIQKLGDMVLLQRKENYDNSSFSELNNTLKENSKYIHLNEYLHLLEAINLLRDRKLNEAYQYIIGISSNELPLGYLSVSIAIITLSLKIKLQKKKIKNGTLIPLINPILLSQAPHTEYIPSYPGQMDNPIVTDANNITIMRSIKLYNNMINNISHPEHKDTGNIYPQSVSGTLGELDILLGKIIDIYNMSDVLSNDEIIEKLAMNNTITIQTLKHNFISFLNHCTLYNCITSLNVLFCFLNCPGERFENINSFILTSMKNPEKRKRLCRALKTMQERYSISQHKPK
ncbi:hypothetical protein ACRZ29_000240 [Edwardsiella piscicida]